MKFSTSLILKKKIHEPYARKRERKWAIKWRKTEREKVRMKKSMWKMTTTAVAAITNTSSKNNWHNARRECSTENGKVNDTIYNAYARTHILLAIFFLSLFYIEHSHQFLVWILLAKWEILYSQSADVDECICICASMCICAIKPKLAVCSCKCVCVQLFQIRAWKMCIEA